MNYVMLFNWTDQGLKNFRDSPKRADATASAFEKFGGRMKDVYWTQGEYDGVIFGEFPTDEAASAAVLAICGQGYVKLETLKAFSKDEFKKIVEKTG